MAKRGSATPLEAYASRLQGLADDELLEAVHQAREDHKSAPPGAKDEAFLKTHAAEGVLVGRFGFDGEKKLKAFLDQGGLSAKSPFAQLEISELADDEAALAHVEHALEKLSKAQSWGPWSDIADRLRPYRARIDAELQRRRDSQAPIGEGE